MYNQSEEDSREISQDCQGEDIDTSLEAIYSQPIVIEIADENENRSFDYILRDIVETSKIFSVNQQQEQSLIESGSNSPKTPTFNNLYENVKDETEPNILLTLSKAFNCFSSNHDSVHMTAPDNSYENIIETGCENTSSTNPELDDYMQESGENPVDIASDNNIKFVEVCIPSESVEEPCDNKYYQKVQSIQFAYPQKYQIPVRTQLEKNQTKNTHIVKDRSANADILKPRAVLAERNRLQNEKPLFILSDDSAFNPYHKVNEHRLPQNLNANYFINYEVLTENQENIGSQPGEEPINVFEVSEESIQNGQPQWVVQKRHIDPDTITIRPPLQTKLTIEIAKERAITDLFSIDFSNFDTSNIVLPTIEIRGPPHKKRKQEFVNLQNPEIHFKGFEIIDIINNNCEAEISNNDINNEKNFNFAGSQNNENKNVNKKSDCTCSDFEACLQSLLSRKDLRIVKKAKPDIIDQVGCSISEPKNIEEKNYNASCKEEKSLRCEYCEKCMKTLKTLKAHKKRCELSKKTKPDKENSIKEVLTKSGSPKKEMKNSGSLINKLKLNTKVEIYRNIVTHPIDQKPDDDSHNTNIVTKNESKNNKDSKNSSESDSTKKVEKTTIPRRAAKRRNLNEITIDDAHLGKTKRTVQIKKRKTRSNIISYKE